MCRVCIIASCLVLLVVPLTLVAQTRPARVAPTPGVIGSGDGLKYQTYDDGDRVPDFSYAGFAAGRSELPDVPIRIVVEPADGDDGGRIQRAIDDIAGRSPDTAGFRGTILLGPGEFQVSGQLRIAASGVVLRGSGFGEGGSTIIATGTDRRTLIRIAGSSADRTIGAEVAVTDSVVPVGAMQLSLSAGHGFKAGQSVLVRRPSTASWIEALGMDEFAGDRHGGSWKPGSRDIVWDRTITSATDTQIKLDAPITTSLRAEFGGATVAAYEWPGRIRNSGVENVQLISRPRPDATEKDEEHSWIAVQIDNAQDAWARRIVTRQFVGGAVWVMNGASRVSVEDCQFLDPVSEIAGQRRMAFYTTGQQVLFRRCYARQAIHGLATGFGATGPIAFVECVADSALRESGPLDSWASGILFDNVRIDGNELALVDRDFRLQQAGWVAANSMLWQSQAAVIRVQNPPTARNWAIGCWGQFAGDGLFASSRDAVRPACLYDGQLRERLGEAAWAAAELLFDQSDPSSNPTLEKAAELVAASTQPARTLPDWIEQRAARWPIKIDPGDAPKLSIAENDSILAVDESQTISIRNGWIVFADGRLATGRQSGVTWWAGGARPAEIAAAANKEPCLTRFVPGRDGPGATDVLSEVVDAMRASNTIALSHHAGLWYDTRSADHERVRRGDAGVWPPFYEQPWQRSGQAVAWDGLSRYDLTRFNPWYWCRLREFVQIGQRRGAILLNQQYFQHNLLEAGAHWASYPWRSANNINVTGFPEPPPYAGDKRIFMAEQFYDLGNAPRRKLHEDYINQNLDNFVGQSNVIQLTGEEFTGPLAFVEFWLDTVGTWQARTHGDPIIGLSATKDVQDAILSQPEREKLVDVVDIKYWWPLADGTTYAPAGGKNLSPRQWERLLKPRPPTADALARATADLRARFPDKAVMCSLDVSERFGWEQLLAGGSLPVVPATTESAFLRAVALTAPVPGRAGLRGRDAVIVRLPDGGVVDVDPGHYDVRVIDLGTGAAANSVRVLVGGMVPEPLPGSGDRILWFHRVESDK